jgi:hypothetical protein
MPRLLPATDSADIPRRLARRPACPPAARRIPGRVPLTPSRLIELRRRMAAGDFDTPAHAQSLAWVLLELGVVRG